MLYIVYYFYKIDLG